MQNANIIYRPSDVAPPTFSRHGDWLVGERYGIARNQCWHGTNYSVHSWDYPSDIDATLIGVKQSFDDALKLIPERKLHERN